jgi:hypothetical protein
VTSFVRNECRVLFVHVPKTGGTSVERLFIEAGFERGLFATRDFEGPCSPQHYDAALLRERLALSDFDLVFTVVRHPLDRLLSEYNFRMNVRQRQKQLPPVEFPEWLQQVMRRYKHNPYVQDNHLRPQSEFITERCIVLRYEAGLAPAMAKLVATSPLLQFAGDFGPMPRRQTTKEQFVTRDNVAVGDLAQIRNWYARDFDELGYA